MTAINYYFWGLANLDELPDPNETLPDWAWAEWVEQQGIGE